MREKLEEINRKGKKKEKEEKRALKQEKRKGLPEEAQAVQITRRFTITKSFSSKI